MKLKQRIIAIVLALLMLASVVITGVTALTTSASVNFDYSFANDKPGYAEGKITLNFPQGGNLQVFWADAAGNALEGYRAIGTVNSGVGSIDMPAQTVIPPDAKYIIAGDVKYQIPENKQLSFSSKDALYTFGSISDPQLANDSHGSGSYPNDEVHLKEAFNTLSKRDVDFTVLSGDVVNDQNGNQTYAEEYNTYLKILADSPYSKPIYESNGNHDVATKWDKNGNYYNNNLPFILATGLDSTEETLKKNLPYYEITEPTTGDHFIFMALEGGFYTNKGTQFSTEQLDWLEALLKEYHDDGKNIFIIEHANITGWGSGDKLTTPYYYDLALEKNNADVSRFVSLMETYKECVIITGHTHLELSAQYNYSDNNGTSAVMMHNSAIGGVRRLINGTVDRTAVLGMSEGYIVEVYNDCILFNGINMYYNEIMPQCSYIIPFGTSSQIPTEPDTTPTGTTTPATTEATEPTETTAPATTEATEPTETTAPATTEATEPTPELTYGDTDLNGVVNVKDATAIQKHSASIITLEDVALLQADVTGDGAVNVRDATSVQKFVAGLIAIFPADKSAEDIAEVNTPAPQALEEAMKALDENYALSSYNQYQALKDEFLYRQDYDTLLVREGYLTKIATVVESLKPQANVITIYFTNNRNWSNVYAYVWGSGGNELSGWPGTKMTKETTNSMGQDIYAITLDCLKYQNIIFNNGSGEQTVDVTILQQDNTGYYLEGNSSKYEVGTYTYKGY